MKKSLVIHMQEDFESGPIAKLVQIANKYSSQIYLEIKGRRVNAKSIMGMLSTPLRHEETVVLDVIGEDEAEAAAELEQFLTK